VHVWLPSQGLMALLPHSHPCLMFRPSVPRKLAPRTSAARCRPPKRRYESGQERCRSIRDGKGRRPQGRAWVRSGGPQPRLGPPSLVAGASVRTRSHRRELRHLVGALDNPPVPLAPSEPPVDRIPGRLVGLEIELEPRRLRATLRHRYSSPISSTNSTWRCTLYYNPYRTTSR
jgi:hypothetical protein